MKPTEETTGEKELIAHIKRSLVEHEESYKIGAWEKFNSPKKSRKLGLWLPWISGVAAALVLGLLAFFIAQQNSQQQNVTKTVAANAKITAEQAASTNATAKSNPTEISPNVVQQPARTKRQEDKDLPTESSIADVNVAPKRITFGASEIKSTSKDTTQIVTTAPTLNEEEKPVFANTADKKTNIIDFLEKETKLNQAKETDVASRTPKDKFTVGLVIAPSFGNVKRLNMGYGLNLDYQLSSKFSLNTGLAYNTMGATADSRIDYRQSAPTVSALAQTASSKNLESVEERIAGIEIPLEIKYHVNANVYANMGVSIFGVVNQQRNNTFIEEKIIPQSYAVNGRNTFEVTTMTARITEQDVLKPGEDYTYLGFYNFAFGFKKKLSKKNAFAIEPFVKLPMQKAQTENLKLIGTGVKLKFDF